MKRLLIISVFVLSTVTAWTTVGEAILHAATCVGATPCKACTSCRACKRCSKDGGTCGTCKKPKAERDALS
jgi:hypothetical protein